MNSTSPSSDTAAAQAPVGPNDHAEIEARDDRGRRWYHPRPQPRRRRDLMGFNSTWWMVLLWIAVIALLVWPFPVW
jgi:hypothetical protein